jgi:hypothetical protein
VGSPDDDELVEQFREQRHREYKKLIRDSEKLVKRWRRAKRPGPRPVALREAQAMRERYARILAKDYFDADNAGRAAALVRELETAASDVKRSTAHRNAAPAVKYQCKMRVTRLRTGVDRMASAWLIKKFVDPKARFSFVASAARVPSSTVPFDMYGVEFGHHGSHCTLETLIERFAIVDSATVRLSQVVHDLDMKDGRYGIPECAAVGRVIDGLRQLYRDDDELLTQGIILMEALYRSFSSDDGGMKAPGQRPSPRPQLVRKRMKQMP